MVHGSETRALKVEKVQRKERVKMQVIEVKMKEEKIHEELRIGNDNIVMFYTHEEEGR